LWLSDADQDPANDLLQLILADQIASPEGKLFVADEFVAALIEPARAATPTPGKLTALSALACSRFGEIALGM